MSELRTLPTGLDDVDADHFVVKVRYTGLRSAPRLHTVAVNEREVIIRTTDGN